MAYVYRHIRLDNGQPFYIGIGIDDLGTYKRAYSKANRNRVWINTVNKAGYDIEILIDDISFEFAKEKEKEFISLYGRKDNGTGILCNLTDGGEGAHGVIVGEETRKKQSERKKGKPAHNKGKKMPPRQLSNHGKIRKGKPAWNKGKKMSEEARRNNSLSKKGLMVGNKHPMWGKKMPDYIKEALRKANENRPAWNKGLKMKDSLLVEHREKRRKQMKSVLKYSLDGVFLKEYDSLGEAAREMNCSKGTLSNACIKRGKLKTYRGFFWEYGDSKKNPHIEAY